MSVSPIALVSGIGMIAVAICFFGYALFRRLGWKYAILGAVFWIVSVALKFGCAILVNPWILSVIRPQPGGMLAVAVYGGVLTGIFEVGFVWAILRFSLLGRADWRRVLGFGIGFGAIEALLLGGVSLLLVLASMYVPEKVPPAIVEQLASTDNILWVIAPIGERFFTCLGHIATNVLIFYSIARRKLLPLWLAFLYKSFIDSIATVFLVSGGMKSLKQRWAIECVVAVWGIFGCVIILWVGRRYPAALIDHEEA
jgi:uncharacterized membrane protein YhfC